MINIKNSILFIVILSLFCSCNKKTKPGIQEFCKIIYSPEYSSNFKIEGDNSEDILISVYNPWQGAKNISSALLINRSGTPIYNPETQILKGNAERIICMSSTHIAMLDALGEIDKIVGVSGKPYISNEYILNPENNIPDIGYEGNIDYEKIIALKPDLLLLFSVNGASSMEPKLKELGIPFLYVGDYLEEDPLGKTEWIIPLAETLGKREEGIKIFNEISNRYITLKNEIVNYKKSNGAPDPKVMVNAPFLDAWFMPSCESYIAKMISDAGGDYIYKKDTGNTSAPIDMEEALKLVSDTDYWINIGTFNSIEEIKMSLPNFSSLACIKDKRLYNNNYRSTPGGGNDCYESGVINPDLILRDLIKIFHPQLVEDDFTYYHQLK